MGLLSIAKSHVLLYYSDVHPLLPPDSHHLAPLLYCIKWAGRNPRAYQVLSAERTRSWPSCLPSVPRRNQHPKPNGACMHLYVGDLRRRMGWAHDKYTLPAPAPCANNSLPPLIIISCFISNNGSFWFAHACLGQILLAHIILV